MSLLIFNFFWMTFNIILALIAVVLGQIGLKIKNKIHKSFVFIVWLVFLPNTIYLFTDLINLIHQWGTLNFYQTIVLIIQYGILEVFGFVTFVLALYPFEKSLRLLKINKQRIDLYLIALNLLVAFGITLGRVERINSWDVLEHPLKVFFASIHILSSFDLLGLTVLFAAFSNLSYFLLRKPVMKYFSTYLSQADV